MNRRELCVAVAGLGFATSGLWHGAAQAQARVPQAGKDYLRLDRMAPVEAVEGKVEIVEFFWYNCPHCNAFEPRLNSWLGKAPAHVSFRRVPVGFRPDFRSEEHTSEPPVTL